MGSKPQYSVSVPVAAAFSRAGLVMSCTAQQVLELLYIVCESATMISKLLPQLARTSRELTCTKPLALSIDMTLAPSPDAERAEL